MKYRPDIDGLRAVAVLLVVAFHIRLPGFGAGFIGVDIFFVISGYLITALLVRELDATGKVNLAHFYARRMKRLAPAIVVVLFVVMVASLFVLDPLGQQQDLAKSALASLLFVANIYFANTTGGYFDKPDSEVYLLHFWSLAVEEQFYLCWPVALMVLAAIGGRVRLRVFLLASAIALGLASFAFSVYLTDTSPKAAYFLMPSRMWQLLCGAVLALLLERGDVRRVFSNRIAGGACAVGATAIAVSMWLIQGPQNYPGVIALLPTVGAVFIIGAGAVQPGYRSGLLSNGISVAIGKISFPWYLWHWPLIAMARSYSLGTDSPLRDAGMAALSFVLAVLTYRFIERPISAVQLSPPWASRRVLSLGVGALVCVGVSSGALGLLARRAADMQPWWQINAELVDAGASRPAFREPCHQDVPFGGLAPKQRCVTGDASVGIRAVVWGDSHADHLSPLVHDFGAEAGVGILQRTFSACPPLFGYQREADAAGDCLAFQEAVINELALLREDGATGVILGGHWQPVLESARKRGFSDETLRLPLARTVARLVSLGMRVLIVAPIPDFPIHPLGCLARLGPAECRIDAAAWRAERTELMRLFEGIGAEGKAVRTLELTPFLCDATYCTAKRGDLVVFRDTNHLTPLAARRMLPLARESLEWVTATPTGR